MYRVLIADDEDIIREGFVSFIPWEEFGFQIVKTCENGNQVLAYIQENPVDFILTDIKMLGPTGLDIARYVHENNLPTAVCLVSGYRDFEYARSAIKYNVKYYLTKPTPVEDMIEMVKGIKAQLDSQYAGALAEPSASQFFTDIFMGNYTGKQEILAAAHTLGLDNQDLFLCPFWVKIENYDAYLEKKWKRGKELLFTAVSNFIHDSLRTFTVHSIWINQDELLFLALCSKPDISVSRLQEDLNTAKTSILCMMEMEISFQTGRVFHNMDSFSDYFTNTVWLDESRGLAEDVHHRFQLLEMYKNLILSILLKDNTRLESTFNMVSSIFLALPLETVQASLEDLFGIIFEKLNNISAKDFREYCTSEMCAIQTAASPEQALAAAKNLLVQLPDLLAIKNSPSETIIDKAKEYIASHYIDNISLEDVANYVFLNASYLSRLFKQYTGENFRDYLINIRIGKAVELIHENKYKIGEISSMCGYQNPKYFSQQFKHIMGVSPKEYLAQQGQNE